MHKLAIAICDPDEEYSEKLSQYLMQTGRLTDMACFPRVTEELSEEKRDLWLVHGTLFSQWKRCDFGDQPVLCLTEEEMEDTAAGVSRIYKYQSADLILQAIFQELSKGTYPKQIRGKEKGELILLYQPWYQGIQMLAGFALAQSLTEKGRVLYVNPRGFHGMPLSDNQQEARDISDVLTALSLKSNNMAQRLMAAIVATDGPDYIRPVHLPMQMEGVGTGDFAALVEAIWQYLDYDYVVLELPPEQQGIREMFDLAQKIYSFWLRGYGAKALAAQLKGEGKFQIRWIPEQLENWYRDRPVEELLTDSNRIKEWLLLQGEEDRDLGCVDDGAC
ncbi:MAG: hypothetical protein ACI4DO_05385 [Roseburia sp.]